MNPITSQILFIKIAKSYLSDVDRIWNSDKNEIEKYQNKAFRKIVSFAYNIPLYHDIYKKAGIHPNEIKGIQDLGKIPFITKNDIMTNFPDGIIPNGFDKKNSFLMSTSGSTGKPVFIYTDYFSSLKRLMAFVATSLNDALIITS